MAARAARRSVQGHPLYSLTQQRWKSSGLTDDHARALGLRPLTGEEVRAALQTDRPQAGGVLIPYFDLTGKPTEFFRIRYLEPLPGFAGMVEKPQRYVQPAKTLNEVYLPPILAVKWEEVAKDKDVPIYITEGEFKAAAGCAAGLAVVGLGGVDVWRSTKRGVTLLPALATIKWENRQVVIVYDSDAATNENVVRAQRQLAAELVARGALPAVASLPPTAEGKKQGLDDLLVAQGPEALMKILQDAPFYPEADALWSLNERVAYVRNPGMVVERASGTKLDPGRFVAHHYANLHYIETQTKPNGAAVAKKKKLAPRWLEWEHRFECSQIVYAPGKPRLVDGAWNAWNGWGCEPKKGDVSLWKRLLDHLFGGDDLARTWFERWCAYPLQYPGTKLYSSALIWGRETGTGKTLVAYLLRAIYGDNGIELDSSALGGTFNGWAENRQFVIGDEITAGESRLDKEKMKQLVTRSKLRINQKFVPEYVIDDCINYLFNSNHSDSLFVDDTDRRYFIHEVLAGKAPREFYEELDRWLNGNVPNSGKGPGPAALFDYLLNLDLCGFNPRETAMVTAAKQNMIINSKSELGMWCLQLREDPVNALKPLHGVLGDKNMAACCLFTPRALLRAFDPERRSHVTEATMGRELLKAGFRPVNEGGVVRTRSGVVRLYAVRDVERWQVASHGEISRHFDMMWKTEGRF